MASAVLTGPGPGPNGMRRVLPRRGRAPAALAAIQQHSCIAHAAVPWHAAIAGYLFNDCSACLQRMQRSPVRHGGPRPSLRSAPAQAGRVRCPGLGSAAATRRCSVRYGSPPAMRRRSVRCGSPPAMRRRSVRYGSPPAMRRRSVRYGSPPAMRRRSVRYGSPPAMRRRSVRYGSPPTMRRRGSGEGTRGSQPFVSRISGSLKAHVSGLQGFAVYGERALSEGRECRWRPGRRAGAGAGAP